MHGYVACVNTVEKFQISCRYVGGIEMGAMFVDAGLNVFVECFVAEKREQV